MDHPYNMDERLALAESILDYTFSNKALGLEALMMAGGFCGSKGLVMYKDRAHLVDKNTRLAVVGDRMLAAVVSEAWYATETPRRQETKLREDLTDNTALNDRGKAFGLDKCVMLNGGHKPGDVSMKSMATTMEALLGAIQLDAGGGALGFDAVKKVMIHLGFFEHCVLMKENDDGDMTEGGAVQSVAKTSRSGEDE